MIFNGQFLNLLDSMDSYASQIVLKFLLYTKDNVQRIIIVVVLVRIVEVIDAFSYRYQTTSWCYD